jgi:hypothetical protein
LIISSLRAIATQQVIVHTQLGHLLAQRATLGVVTGVEHAIHFQALYCENAGNSVALSVVNSRAAIWMPLALAAFQIRLPGPDRRPCGRQSSANFSP